MGPLPRFAAVTPSEMVGAPTFLGTPALLLSLLAKHRRRVFLRTSPLRSSEKFAARSSHLADAAIPGMLATLTALYNFQVGLITPPLFTEGGIGTHEFY